MLPTLQGRGWEVAIAVDGKDGVTNAQAEGPALILMDTSLPVLDGCEASRQLKAAPATRGIPIIARTAHAMSGDREKALPVGCVSGQRRPLTAGPAASPRTRPAPPPCP